MRLASVMSNVLNSAGSPTSKHSDTKLRVHAHLLARRLRSYQSLCDHRTASNETLTTIYSSSSVSDEEEVVLLTKGGSSSRSRRPGTVVRWADECENGAVVPRKRRSGKATTVALATTHTFSPPAPRVVRVTIVLLHPTTQQYHVLPVALEDVDHDPLPVFMVLQQVRRWTGHLLRSHAFRHVGFTSLHTCTGVELHRKHRWLDCVADQDVVLAVPQNPAQLSHHVLQYGLQLLGLATFRKELRKATRKKAAVHRLMPFHAWQVQLNVKLHRQGQLVVDMPPRNTSKPLPACPAAGVPRIGSLESMLEEDSSWKQHNAGRRTFRRQASAPVCVDDYEDDGNDNGANEDCSFEVVLNDNNDGWSVMSAPPAVVFDDAHPATPDALAALQEILDDHDDHVCLFDESRSPDAFLFAI